MGNVISLHTEIFIKNNKEGKSLFPAKVLFDLTEPLNWSSYNGYPMIIKEFGSANDRSIRISYGEKYEPRRLFSFFQENLNFIDRMFTRANYESGDLDYIFSLPSNNFNYEEIRRACNYGFDQLFFKLKNKINFTNLSIDTFGDYNSIKLEGTMNAISCLTEIDETDIISFPIENERSLKTFAENGFNSSEENLLGEIIDKSSDVIFKYKGKTVHRKIDTEEYKNQGYLNRNLERMAIKYNKGKYDINSSGWHNCVDKEYLDYLRIIKRDQ